MSQIRLIFCSTSDRDYDGDDDGGDDDGDDNDENDCIVHAL